MRVSVDPDLCAGHGACVVTCPSVFRIGDEGYAEVLVDPVLVGQVPADVEELVLQARDECPTQAIAVADE